MEKEIREFLVKRGCYASWYQDELVKIIREWEQSRQAAVTPALPPDPWPLPDVLVKLADAAEILLKKHDYDGHNYEEIEQCVGRARFMAKCLPGGNAG